MNLSFKDIPIAEIRTDAKRIKSVYYAIDGLLKHMYSLKEMQLPKLMFGSSENSFQICNTNAVPPKKFGISICPVFRTNIENCKILYSVDNEETWIDYVHDTSTPLKITGIIDNLDESGIYKNWNYIFKIIDAKGYFNTKFNISLRVNYSKSYLGSQQLSVISKTTTEEAKQALIQSFTAKGYSNFYFTSISEELLALFGAPIIHHAIFNVINIIPTII